MFSTLLPAFAWLGRAGEHQDDYDRCAQRQRDHQVALHLLIHGLGLVPRPGRSKPNLVRVRVGVRVRVRVRVMVRVSVRVSVSVGVPRSGRSEPRLH